jgi:hypothetical protein
VVHHNDEIDLTTTAVDVLAAAVKTSKKRKKITNVLSVAKPMITIKVNVHK